MRDYSLAAAVDNTVFLREAALCKAVLGNGKNGGALSEYAHVYNSVSLSYVHSRNALSHSAHLTHIFLAEAYRLALRRTQNNVILAACKRHLHQLIARAQYDGKYAVFSYVFKLAQSCFLYKAVLRGLNKVFAYPQAAE